MRIVYLTVIIHWRKSDTALIDKRAVLVVYSVEISVDEVNAENAGANSGTIFRADVYSSIYVVLWSIVAGRLLRTVRSAF